MSACTGCPPQGKILPFVTFGALEPPRGYATRIRAASVFVAPLGSYSGSVSYPLQLNILNLADAASVPSTVTTTMIFQFQPASTEAYNQVFEFDGPMGLMSAGLNLSCGAFVTDSTGNTGAEWLQNVDTEVQVWGELIPAAY